MTAVQVAGAAIALASFETESDRGQTPVRRGLTPSRSANENTSPDDGADRMRRGDGRGSAAADRYADRAGNSLADASIATT